ncbi:Gfo/Idh/MocA family protein [Portibacter lacus]
MKFFLIIFFSVISLHAKSEKLKLGVVGLTHTHVHWILGYPENEDFEVVGYVEPNLELATRYANQYNISLDLVYSTLEEMLAVQKVDAVAAFGTIYDHLAVVQECAPRGIHVMVEKPLAVNLNHAKKMAALAKKHNVHLITNYETTWYPSNIKANELLKAGKIGDLRKIIVNDGHRGPKKIGVNEEFLEWLTDPIDNGGGAITDFGCYGANLSTWIHNGKKPLSVTANTQQLQKENNPKVDDEAIIILDYGSSNAILQPSWNWPIGRKDMEIYGLTGAIFADNKNDLRIRIAEGYDGYSEEKIKLEDRKYPYADPFTFFAGVINGTIEVKPFDLSSIENNIIVIEILDAARKSAKTGKRVYLK